jgi:AcrR family transcriptional regulator
LQPTREDDVADAGTALSGLQLRRPQRADARRNFDALLAAAREVFADQGTDASLEDVARRAGVGIGTLYRHFPSRQALLEAVYRDQVESLSARAEELAGAQSPLDALAEWLRAMLKFSSTKRSMTSALLATLGTDSELLSACATVIRGSAETLLARAQQAGMVRQDADAGDVMRLVHAVNIATEKAADPGQADRMLALILDGLRPRPAS